MHNENKNFTSKNTTFTQNKKPNTEFFRQGFVKPKIIPTWKNRYIDHFNFKPEEDQIFLSNHLNHLEKKRNFDFEELLKTKISVYENSKEIKTSQCQAFEELTSDVNLIQNLKDMQIKTLTPIQKTVIPLVSGKFDIMACAQTGSGKTIAFLFPILNQLLKDGPECSITTRYLSFPYVLVLVPVRELAEQIFSVCRLLLRGTYIRVTKLYGGVAHDEQIKDLKSGVDIIISTPGRLYDFLVRDRISLSQVKYLVLDEADRMLDMGFEKQINQILSNFGRLNYIYPISHIIYSIYYINMII